MPQLQILSSKNKVLTLKRNNQELHTGRNLADGLKAAPVVAFSPIRQGKRGAYETKQMNEIKDLA
jgi:hypothetical protein